MRVVLLTPVRMLGEGLRTCLEARGGIVVAIVSSVTALGAACAAEAAHVALIDVTQGVDLEEVGTFAAAWPELAILALGLNEQRQEVIRFGRAGFTGYVGRDASIERLHDVIANAAAGRLACPAEISDGLMRALFRREGPVEPQAGNYRLTPREEDVLRLIGGGLSNKEIARELELSVATVKHHVHNVLGKLQLPRRAQAMRMVRGAPWLTSSGSKVCGRPRSTVCR